MTIHIKEVQEYEHHFVVIQDRDGTEGRVGHFIPKDALEWRAAEYEIDPADIDTLLTVVLYEPLLDGNSHEHPKHLYNADSIAEAREYHLGRIKAAAKAHPISDPDGHLDTVRRKSHMHPEALALKAAHVDRGRWLRRSRKAADPHEDRLATLRANLSTPEPPATALREPEAGKPADTNALLRKDR